MSEENEKNKVVVGKEDTDNIRNYSLHFNVPLTEELKKAMDRFDSDMSYKNMLAFKLELCKWLVSSEHEALKDPLWNHPKSRSESIIYDLQFDQDVVDILAESSDSSTKKANTGDAT